MSSIGMRKRGIMVNILNWTKYITKVMASCRSVAARKSTSLRRE
jgi:hypothetical protein